MSDQGGYVLTEIWKAKSTWLELAADDRIQFFEQKVGPILMNFLGSGAELLACAVNDNTGPERIDYQYMAVWKFPDKASSDQLESAAKDAGFLEYFDQVNFSGAAIPPEALNSEMIGQT